MIKYAILISGRSDQEQATFTIYSAARAPFAERTGSGPENEGTMSSSSINGELRQESRNACNMEVGVYLSHGIDGKAMTPVFRGRLISLSRRGAGIALDEVMAGPTHLAYSPMESEAIRLTLVFLLQENDENLRIESRPVWLNKQQHDDIPPFRIGVEFIDPLTNELFRQLNRQYR